MYSKIKICCLVLALAACSVVIAQKAPAEESKPEINIGGGNDWARDAIVPTEPVKVFTRQWQTLMEGQAIPPGLHVRMDFESHKKQAKLMDSTPTPATAMVLLGSDDDEDETTDAPIGNDTMSEEASTDDESGIKFTFKESVDDTPRPGKGWSEEGMRLAKFRVQSLADSALSVREKQRLLMELEEDLHDIELADIFTAANGIPQLLTMLSHTDTTVRASAALAFGSCVQSNRPLQTTATEKLQAVSRVATFLSEVVATLDTSTDTHTPSNTHSDITADDTGSTRVHEGNLEIHNGLYALSSLVSYYPEAYRKLVLSRDHMAMLQSILAHPHAKRSDQIKVLSILGDVMVAESDVSVAEGEKAVSTALLRAFADTSSVWCTRSAQLLQESVTLDDNQKVLVALVSVAPACAEVFRADAGVKRHIVTSIASWQTQIDTDEDATWVEYLTTIRDTAQTIADAIA